jgi:hypothetical protein
MSSSGTFTVPFDGVYLFSFSTTSYTNNVYTYVDIRVDGFIIGGFELYDMQGRSSSRYGNEDLSASSQVVASLKKGQRVDAYLRSGYISYEPHFVGHLLFPQ